MPIEAQPEAHNDSQANNEYSLKGFDDQILQLQLTLELLRSHVLQERLKADQVAQDLIAGTASLYDVGFAAGRLEGLLQVLRTRVIPEHLSDLRLVVLKKVVVVEIMHLIKCKEIADENAAVARLLPGLGGSTSTQARRLLAQQRKRGERLRDFFESIGKVEQWRKEHGKITLEEIANRIVGSVTFAGVVSARGEAIASL